MKCQHEARRSGSNAVAQTQWLKHRATVSQSFVPERRLRSLCPFQRNHHNGTLAAPASPRWRFKAGGTNRGSRITKFPLRLTGFKQRSMAMQNTVAVHLGISLIPWLALNLPEGEGVSNHFNIDFSSGWHAHGDRIKAASSARTWQNCHFKHHLCLSVNHLEFW